MNKKFLIFCMNIFILSNISASDRLQDAFYLKQEVQKILSGCEKTQKMLQSRFNVQQSFLDINTCEEAAAIYLHKINTPAARKLLKELKLPSQEELRAEHEKNYINLEIARISNMFTGFGQGALRSSGYQQTIINFLKSRGTPEALKRLKEFEKEIAPKPRRQKQIPQKKQQKTQPRTKPQTPKESPPSQPREKETNKPSKPPRPKKQLKNKVKHFRSTNKLQSQQQQSYTPQHIKKTIESLKSLSQKISNLNQSLKQQPRNHNRQKPKVQISKEKNNIKPQPNAIITKFEPHSFPENVKGRINNVNITIRFDREINREFFQKFVQIIEDMHGILGKTQDYETFMKSNKEIEFRAHSNLKRPRAEARKLMQNFINKLIKNG